MDVQVVAKRMIDADGIRTEAEQALLDVLVETQEVITEVEREIVGYCTVVRTGQMPRRMLRSMTHDEPEAA
jgi:hypothetical protein